MSTFNLGIRPIERIMKHPNADSLELVKLKGLDWQFVTQIGLYKEGDLVIFFPVDTIMSEELIKDFDLVGKLGGTEHNRVKTIRLRGEYSQGLIAPLRRYFVEGEQVPTNLAEYFGVSKYEEPPVFSKAGNLHALPQGVEVYDIEGAQNYPEVIEALMDQPVYITEKLEGSNWGLYMDNTGKEVIFQRRYAIDNITGETHAWRTVAKEQGLFELARNLLSQKEDSIILRGEICGPGIQGNIYKLKEVQIFLFDVQINGQYVDTKKFLEITTNETRVPTIAIANTLREFLGKQNKSLLEFSNGRSLLHDTKREGVVIKPMTEQYHPSIGRLFIKQRSPEYLLKADT